MMYDAQPAYALASAWPLAMQGRKDTPNDDAVADSLKYEFSHLRSGESVKQ